MTNKPPSGAFLTPEEWGVVRDALEHRVRNCRELYQALKHGPTNVEKKLSAAFKKHCEEAERVYKTLEEKGLI